MDDPREKRRGTQTEPQDPEERTVIREAEESGQRHARQRRHD